MPLSDILSQGRPRDEVWTHSQVKADDAPGMEEAQTSSHEGARQESDVTVAGPVISREASMGRSAIRSEVENEPSSAGGHLGTEPAGAGDTTQFSGGAQRPGTFHPSHVLMRAAQYVFCASCGAYGKQIRRIKLRMDCPRTPRNRWARLKINALMSGVEPDGRDTAHRAKPYLSD